MIKLFSGTNSTYLAQKVAKLADIALAEAEVIRFENSEVRVRIIEKVKDQVCAVLQTTSNPTDTNIMELLFFCDALKRSQAKKVVAIIPYFGYARQNIQHREGEDVSAHVIVKVLESVGFDEVWTVDLHDEGTQGIFSIPLKHLSALPLLADSVKKYLQTTDGMVVASPDQGGVDRGRVFAEALLGNKNAELVVVEKKRDLEHIHKSKAISIYGEVKDKTVVLVDDIVTLGGTLLNAAELCLEKGAKKIVAAVTHHDFAGDVEKRIQSSRIEKFFTTDTILLKDGQKFPKLEEISIAPLITEQLKRLSE